MEQTDNIIHVYPTMKDVRLYTHRYTVEHFDKYKDMSNENYEKLKTGINYTTNRKIKIDGKTYQKILCNFYLKIGTSYDYEFILFTKLNDINSDLYIQETEKLKHEIEHYNLQVHEIIYQINLLEKWD